MNQQKQQNDPRSMARLNAVQALYGIVITEASVTDVIKHFVADMIGANGIEEDPDTGDETEVPLGQADQTLLIRLVRGVFGNIGVLDRSIDAALSKDWSASRLEITLRCILRAAVWELINAGDTPPRVIINEYMDIANAFYDGPEPAMVNAVLDKIARTVREGGLKEKDLAQVDDVAI